MLDILDVAPLILYSLGLPIPSNLEGSVPGQVFEPGFWASHPPEESEASTSPSRPHRAEQVYTEDDEKELWEALSISLGEGVRVAILPNEESPRIAVRAG